MTNNRLKRTLEFDLADAPMLVGALSIAACTAKMCGFSKAAERLREYQKLVKEFSPPASDLFDDEAWAEIGMELSSAKTFKVTIDKLRWEQGEFNHWSGGAIVIEIGERRWYDRRMCDRFKPGAVEVEAVCRALQEIAPMDCVGSFDDRTKDRPY